MTGVAAVPICLIGGYLGAGKTTLINHLLRHAEGRRITVFVNDFGSINIDADLIETIEGSKLSLANGCACCAVGGDLMNALLALDQAVRDDPAAAPDHLVIEASGVADPWKIAQIGFAASTVTGGFRLDAIIVLTDALNLAAQLADKYVGESVARQFAHADLVVLNKADLASPADLADAQSTIARLAPQARVLKTSHGRLSPAILLEEDYPERVFTPAASNALSNGFLQSISAGDAHGSYVSAAWQSATPINRQAFEEALRALPESVVRGKGIVQFEGEATATVWHRVGSRDTFRETPENTDISRWVLIAKGDAAGTLSGVFRRIGTSISRVQR